MKIHKRAFKGKKSSENGARNCLNCILNKHKKSRPQRIQVPSKKV